MSSSSSTSFAKELYHERQQGSMCAQHCLNTLLQQELFGVMDLYELGKQIDASEAELASPVPADGPSASYDDSGFFSVQVIQKALSIYGLEIIPFKAAVMEEVRKDPITQRAFILNAAEHWYTIRRFGTGPVFFDLNSLNASPTYIAPGFLSLLLEQMQSENNYTIFVVVGDLPLSEADLLADGIDFSNSASGVVEKDTPHSESAASSKMGFLDGYDEELERAILASLKK